MSKLLYLLKKYKYIHWVNGYIGVGRVTQYTSCAQLNLTSEHWCKGFKQSRMETCVQITCSVCPQRLRRWGALQVRRYDLNNDTISPYPYERNP